MTLTILTTHDHLDCWTTTDGGGQGEIGNAEKNTGRKFALSAYKDITGRTLPPFDSTALLFAVPSWV